MNRAVSGTVFVSGSDRPLSGLQVVVVRVRQDALEVLGASYSGFAGRFRVHYPPVDGPVDLTLFIFSHDGRHLFTEPVHRQICGAELSLRVEVPQAALGLHLH